MLALPDFETEPAPWLPDSLTHIQVPHDRASVPTSRPSQTLLPLTADSPRLLVAAKVRGSKNEAPVLVPTAPPEHPEACWLQQPRAFPSGAGRVNPELSACLLAPPWVRGQGQECVWGHLCLHTPAAGRQQIVYIFEPGAKVPRDINRKLDPQPVPHS